MTSFSFLRLTRRHFLAGAGGLALTAALPLMARAADGKKGPVRYCAIVPEADDLVPERGKSDMRWVDTENPKMVFPAGLDSDDFKEFRTLLTIVDEDGQNVRRVWVPGMLHTGTFWGDKILLTTRGKPSAFYRLDVNKMKIDAFATPDEGYLFGGHVIPWLKPGEFAVTVNSQNEGAYDRVDVFDGATMKKIRSINSYGFQAHELALSPDHKLLYVGHYGSYYTSGPYRHFHDEHASKLRSPGGDIGYYPGSVAVIDLKTDKLIDRLSDTRNGAQGHIAPSSKKQVFLTRIPPLLKSRKNTMTDPIFAEGTENKVLPPELYNALDFKSSGTTVTVDEKSRQFLLAYTMEAKMRYGSLDNPAEATDVDMKEYAGKPCGIAFHPDGEHYIVSCDNGFAVLKRGTHEVMKDKTIALRLDWHSHMCAG